MTALATPIIGNVIILLRRELLVSKGNTMTTKELAVKHHEDLVDFFNWPMQFDLLDEFAPRRWFSKNFDANSIRIEEFVKDGKLIIKAEMPGINPDKDIDVSIHDGYLTIRGVREESIKDDHRCEFHYGSFTRSISLPRGYDEKSIHADYKHGILEVSMDVPSKVNEGRKIQVNKSL